MQTPMRQPGWKIWQLVAVFCLVAVALPAADAAPVPPPAPRWTALWQDSYPTMTDPGFNPERMSAVVAVDRSTGDAYLSMWDHGIWKSSDAGKTFARVDGGKISGRGCGPLFGNSFYVTPADSQLATFNMNNGPGPSGISADGGKTWTAFTACGRNWDIGAIDWTSHVVLAARHEHDELHTSADDGQTWTTLARTRTDPWVTGLGVLDKTLLIASAGVIERSTDEGKTWNKVADFGAVGPAVVFKDKLWWLSPAKPARVLCSADQGQSWTGQGVAAPGEAKLGPFFGKDENHIVVVGDAGFYETTDGAKSWKLAVALPEDFALGSGHQSAAFDPVHDIFYASQGRFPVMRYARAAAPAYAEPAVVYTQPDDTVRPAVEFVEAAHAKVRCYVNNAIVVQGDYLYQAGEDGIMYFKRDLETGKLKFEQQLTELKSGGFTLAAAGGRLYAVTPHDGYRRIKWHGLSWYGFDPKNGEPIKKAVIDCPGSRQMLVAPDQKNLYLKESRGKADHLFQVQIAADGTPAKVGEVSGRGIGSGVHCDYPGVLVMTPDAKFLYTVSADDYAIAIVERKPTGELAHKDVVGLETIQPRIDGNDRFLWTSLAVSPDGKYLYAAIRNGKPTDNVYGIFNRDTDTGALTLQEKVGGAVDPLANQKGWNMVFPPNSRGGFLGSFAGPLMTFAYDPATGHLLNPATVKETKGSGSSLIQIDPDHHLLYAAGREYGWDRIFALKFTPPPPPVVP